MAIIKPGQLSSGSYSISGSFSGSFFGDGSNLANLPIPQIETGSFVTTSSFNAFTGSYNTGSFTGSFTGDGSGLTGIVSASYALTASYAVSASYEINYETSSSYAETASVAISASYTSTASFYQETDPIFVAKSASLATTGSNNFNGNQTITGSLIQGLEGNIATGENSHAEGSITKAIGDYSHAEGDFTQAVGNYSHAEGQETIASGSYSHAEGYGTIALGDRQHVTGQYNFVSPVQSAFIVGNGTDNNNRSNLIYAAGNEVQISGSLTVNNGITGSLFGTSSWSTNSLTASYVQTAQTASYVLNAVSASYATSALSSSYALSASFAPSTPAFPFTGSALITGSLDITGSASILAYTSSAVKIFSVRNSTNTYDIISNYGSELTIIGRNESSEPRLLINRAGSTKMTLAGTTDLNIQFPSSGFGQLNSGTQGWDIISSTGDIRTRNSSTFTLLKGNFFGIGQATPAARLDVLAQGALSTDIALRVRNSADNNNFITIAGNGDITVGNSTVLPSNSTFRVFSGFGGGNYLKLINDSTSFGVYHGIDMTSTGRPGYFALETAGNQGSSITRFRGGGSNSAGAKITAYIDHPGDTDRQGHWHFRTQVHLGDAYRAYRSTLGNHTLLIETGSAPTTSSANSFIVYASASTANNAQPTFRTENGTIVWIGSESRLFNVTASNITASSVVSSFTGSLTGSVTNYETAWTPYTPVWTAASIDPVIGNGTIEGWYKVIGKTCFVRGNIVMGSTTTFGSGEWYVSMPFTASNADSILMTANLLDNGSAWYNAVLNGARAGFNYKTPIQYQAVGGTANDVNATQPFTWANSDRFLWNGTYELI
jgi:hypothetical protein